MARNLRSEVRAIARRLRPAAGRFVLVWGDEGGGPPIERVGPDGANLSLRVPGGDGDPMDRLTAGQRSLIGPDDTVIVVRYVAKEVPDHA